MEKKITNRIENIINNEKYDEAEVMYQLKTLILEQELKTTDIKGPTLLKNLVSNAINKLQENSDDSNCIKTGFSAFDKEFGGIIPGEYIIIGGRPAMGKTQFMINLALNISVENPILYFTFELSGDQLSKRFISTASKLEISKILQNKLSLEENIRLENSITEFENRKIYISETGSDSVSWIKIYCEKYIEEYGVKVIIIDYLQLMSSQRHSRIRDLEIGFISRELKKIAKEYNISIIVSSQLNRSVESRSGDKRPILSDLRDSGSIEQDADKVIFIHRPEYYGITADCEGNSLIGMFELIIAKNRNGKLGNVFLSRSADWTSISDFKGFKDEIVFESSRMNELTDDFDIDKDIAPF